MNQKWPRRVLRKKIDLHQKRVHVRQMICVSREAIQIIWLDEALILAKHYAALNFWFFSFKRKEHPNSLNNGSYFYKIAQDGIVLKTDKLVLNK